MTQRAVQDTFYLHIIPLLLWDDCLKFTNRHRATLKAVSRRARDAVANFEFPQAWLERRVEAYFTHNPHDVTGRFFWQQIDAFVIAKGMILQPSRIWYVRVDRRRGKTFFCNQFARMLQGPVQVIYPSERTVSGCYLAPPIRQSRQLAILPFPVTIIDDFPFCNFALQHTNVNEIPGTVILTTSRRENLYYARCDPKRVVPLFEN